MSAQTADVIAEPFTDGWGPVDRWARDQNLPEVMETIFQRLSEGESLKAICKIRGWPYSIVARWIAKEEVARTSYETALAIWGDALAQETVAISDEQALAVSKQGVPFDPDVARDALRIKTRQWAAERAARARWGDSKAAGGGGGGVKVVLVNFTQAPDGRVIEATATAGGINELEAGAAMVPAGGRQISGALAAQKHQGD